jgi:PKD repeat protein
MQANFISYYDPQDEFPVAVSFQSLNPNATGWLWNFGDGTTSTEENPVHTYQVDGDYQVSLTITTAECTVSSSGSAFADEAIAENQESASGGSTVVLRFRLNLWLFVHLLPFISFAKIPRIK